MILLDTSFCIWNYNGFLEICFIDCSLATMGSLTNYPFNNINFFNLELLGLYTTKEFCCAILLNTYTVYYLLCFSDRMLIFHVRCLYLCSSSNSVSLFLLRLLCESYNIHSSIFQDPIFVRTIHLKMNNTMWFLSPTLPSFTPLHESFFYPPYPSTFISLCVFMNKRETHLA